MTSSVYLLQDDDDAVLVRRCLDGDVAAFEPLVDKYQRPLFNVALRMLIRYDDATDATQTAFVKAFAQLSTFDPDRRFFSWIYRILKNECLNMLRAKRAYAPLPSSLRAAGAPSDAMDQLERQRAVQKALASLSVEYREVIALRHFTELSYEDIAAALGIPARTVKSRLYSARQRLGELLGDWKVH